MSIPLKKAIEILVLNLSEAGKKMPPDVRDSLMVAIDAMKRYQSFRADCMLECQPLLNGEAEPEDD